MGGNIISDYNPTALLARRMNLGMTQGQLAQAVGAQTGDISRWEVGAKGIPEDIFKKLAFMFGCAPEDLKIGRQA